MRRGLFVLALALLPACTGGSGSGGAGGGEAEGGRDDGRSVYAYRRFATYRDGDGALMLLDARSGRTWYRAGDTAAVWRPFRVLAPEAARNYSPLRGLRRDAGRVEDDDGDGGPILLRFEIQDPRALPLLLDRRSGRTWVRQIRPDGPWWIPLQVVPADTSGNFAPLQVEAAPPPR